MELVDSRKRGKNTDLMHALAVFACFLSICEYLIIFANIYIYIVGV